jgi:hypothetical protein
LAIVDQRIDDWRSSINGSAIVDRQSVDRRSAIDDPQ